MALNAFGLFERTVSLERMLSTTEKRMKPVIDAVESVTGARLSRTTVRSWCVDGVNGTKLKAIRLGGKWYATEAAVERFVRELNQNSI
ncbi:MAG: DUF1580 domain-containing protein [Aureliella sp.]